MPGAPPRPSDIPEWCESITPECPVEGTIYGYTPDLAANAFFAAFFGIALIAQLYFGIRYKTWTYMIAVGLGCLAECVGYIGRVMLNRNPWNDIGFNIQIVLRKCLCLFRLEKAPLLIVVGSHLRACFLGCWYLLDAQTCRHPVWRGVEQTPTELVHIHLYRLRHLFVGYAECWWSARGHCGSGSEHR